jgi:2-polyprenyl-6-methoxyphenol hydroxylase-like FAD-dependent oxidoreductase
VENAGSFETHTGAVDPRYDVVILGGGLAGLTLGLQLKRADQDLSILVLEKRSGPAPEATFKVGESTVDASGFYFSQVLGLKDHMDSRQNRKLGLRFFYPANGNEDIAQRVELGLTKWKQVPSYQLDRGRFENELWARNDAVGNTMCDGARVEDLELTPGTDDHSVVFSRGGEQATVKAGWVVGASGRAALIKNKLGLAIDSPHHINSSWFRLDGGLDIESWSDDQEWLDRMPERGMRQFSTNHLMGEGYWVWLIPLHSGPISIGICADPRFHPYDKIDTLERTLRWLREHEPQLGEEVTARRHQILDFLKVEDFAHDCSRVYSPDRWVLTGDAGVFADPLYSPGSNLIGFTNTFITDLITRDHRSELTDDRIETLNSIMLITFRGILNSYTDQYKVFGHPRVSAVKQFLDQFAVGLTVTLLFRNHKLHDLDFMGKAGGNYARIIRIGTRCQDFYRQWIEVEHRPSGPAMVAVNTNPVAERIHDELIDPKTDEELLAILAQRGDEVEALAVIVFWEALGALPGHGLDETAKINPYAIGLDPTKWEDDGLLDGSGLTLAEARERYPGTEFLHLPEPAEITAN